MAALGSSTALFAVSFALSAAVCAASLAESMVAWDFDIVMVEGRVTDILSEDIRNWFGLSRHNFLTSQLWALEVE